MASQNTSSLRRWILSLPPTDWVLQRFREILIGSLKCGPIPQHIAFVMDGNRRYARSNGLETVEGHNKGFEALARILEVCYKSGVKVVTIYAFSIENFKRPRWEVDALMDMAKTRLVQMSQHGELFQRYGARVMVLGDQSLVRDDVQREIQRAVELTKHNEHAVLNVCFPYTSREEMTQSVRSTVQDFSVPDRPNAGQKRMFSESHIQRNIHSTKLAAVVEEEVSPERGEKANGTVAGPPASEADSTEISEADIDGLSVQQAASSRTSNSPSPDLPPTKHAALPSPSIQKPLLPDPETITAETLTKHMYTADAPPLDLLIRTSGVNRLSDFMLWQCHEDTEVRFLDCLWPEFDLWHFLPVLTEWQWRRRKEMERWEAGVA